MDFTLHFSVMMNEICFRTCLDILVWKGFYSVCWYSICTWSQVVFLSCPSRRSWFLFLLRLKPLWSWSAWSWSWSWSLSWSSSGPRFRLLMRASKATQHRYNHPYVTRKKITIWMMNLYLCMHPCLCVSVFSVFLKDIYPRRWSSPTPDAPWCSPGRRSPQAGTG